MTDAAKCPHNFAKVNKTTYQDFKGCLAAKAKMIRLITMISDATVTAITGKRLSHENVSPLRNDTAKTSAQLELVADEALFVIVSLKH